MEIKRKGVIFFSAIVPLTKFSVSAFSSHSSELTFLASHAGGPSSRKVPTAPGSFSLKKRLVVPGFCWLLLLVVDFCWLLTVVGCCWLLLVVDVLCKGYLPGQLVGVIGVVGCRLRFSAGSASNYGRLYMSFVSLT